MKKRSIPVIGVLVFCALFVTSCEKEYSSEKGIVTADSSVLAKTILNQAYSTNAAQTADLYLPAKRTNSTKVLILLHGGFWSIGDKADIDSAVLILQQLYPALAIVNMNYRLANYTDASTQFPAQMADIKLMLDYLTANKDSLKISTNYALAGISAGGQLALEFAYKYDVPQRVKLVGGLVPPTNFVDPYYANNTNFQTIAYNFIGKPFSDTASYIAASPARIITASAPPTFVSFGGQDTLVPVSSAALLQTQLAALNITYSYQVYGNEGHVFTTPTMLDALTKFVVFLKSFF